MTRTCPNCGSSWMGEGGYCDICRTHNILTGLTPEQVSAARHNMDKRARFNSWQQAVRNAGE